MFHFHTLRVLVRSVLVLLMLWPVILAAWYCLRYRDWLPTFRKKAIMFFSLGWLLLTIVFSAGLSLRINYAVNNELSQVLNNVRTCEFLMFIETTVDYEIGQHVYNIKIVDKKELITEIYNNLNSATLMALMASEKLIPTTQTFTTMLDYNDYNNTFKITFIGNTVNINSGQKELTYLSVKQEYLDNIYSLLQSQPTNYEYRTGEPREL
ncbi:MAG: hypothetical protein KAS23_10830 [Anaerohalosphaera sp.]|nr:hypothetical protein [Anaerohalosphaera sp.]